MHNNCLISVGRSLTANSNIYAIVKNVMSNARLNNRAFIYTLTMKPNYFYFTMKKETTARAIIAGKIVAPVSFIVPEYRLKRS